MACKCLKEVQKKLEEKNAHVVIESLINFKTGKIRDSPPSLRLEKNEKKRRTRLPTLFCTFCPFCGKKY